MRSAARTPEDVWRGAAPGAWFTISMLTIVYIYAWIDRSVFGILLDSIRIDLKLNDTQMSLIGSLGFAVCYTTLQLPAGRIADLYNRRNLIVAGILVWSVMTAACGLAGGFLELLIGRMGIGIGEAALVPAAYSMICDLFSASRVARPLAAFLTGGSLGSGLALILGGVLLVDFGRRPGGRLFGFAPSHPWQAVFLVLGAAGVTIAVLMFFVLREPGRQTQMASRHDGSIGSVVRFLTEVKTFFIPFMIGTTLVNLVAYGYGTWLPVLFIRTFHWHPGRVGLWLGITVLAFGTPAPLAAAWCVRRLQRHGDAAAVVRVIILGSALLLATATALPLVSHGESAVWILAAFQFGAGVLGGVLPAAILLVSPGRIRAQVAAFWLFVANIVGIGFGPTLFALVTDFVFRDPAALRFSMSAVAAVCLIGSVLAFWRAVQPFRQLVVAIHADLRPA